MFRDVHGANQQPTHTHTNKADGIVDAAPHNPTGRVVSHFAWAVNQPLEFTELLVVRECKVRSWRDIRLNGYSGQKWLGIHKSTSTPVLVWALGIMAHFGVEPPERQSWTA